MIKLALCGAHGTGKTTLLKDIAKMLPEAEVIAGIIRPFWQSVGVEDFEQLPKSIRGEFEKYLILNQLKHEDSELAQAKGFITDRSIVDYWGYTVASSDLQEPDLSLFKELIKARAKSYTHLIFVPVMFEAKNETLRANVESRDVVSNNMLHFLEQNLDPAQYLILGEKDHLKRLEQIKEYVFN